MSGINLSQSQNFSGSAVAKRSSSDKGFLISIVILIITLLIFGGLKFITISLSSKKAEIESQIKNVSSELSREEVNRVADFQKRIDNIKTDFNSEILPNETLSSIAEAMIPGAVATSIGYTPNGILVVFKADNYQTVAKQILSLKNSGFGYVKISKIERGTSEKEEISVSLDLEK